MKKNEEIEIPETSEQPDDAVIGAALRRSLPVVLGLVIVVAGVVIWANWPKTTPEVKKNLVVPAKPRDVDEASVPMVRFTDISEDSGIQFVHTNGAFGDKLLPETMGGGVAFFDFDNDGDQDILFVNSCHWSDAEENVTATLALYENNGGGKFKDVTERCGLDVTLYGMGVAVGDFDNDGWRDVFITAVGPNRLFRNVEGKFTDVTEKAGVTGGEEAWGTSCGWFDYDNDGLLDLFVCNYVRWTADLNRELGSTLDGVNPSYDQPTLYDGAFPYLYRNDGDGKFTDVTEAAGLHVKNPLTGVPVAKALGVVFFDFDEDGWMDIVVANDTVQNQLFHNLGNGRFAEIGDQGIAFDVNGQATGAMGIDAAYFRNDQSVGVAVGNFASEPTSLYVANSKAMRFRDLSTATSLGPQTRLPLTFGLFFFDYDLDGRLDLFAANGHLEEEISKKFKKQEYRQPPQLFWNAGPGKTEFVPVTAQHVGDDFHQPMVGRGAAFADIDEDGDLDILITSIGAKPRLLRNDQQLGNHWMQFKLIGQRCNRDALGAWIEVHTAGSVLKRQVAATRSYLSQVELPVTIGLGKVDKVDKVVIRWPDGADEELVAPTIDRRHEIQQSVD